MFEYFPLITFAFFRYRVVFPWISHTMLLQNPHHLFANQFLVVTWKKAVCSVLTLIQNNFVTSFTLIILIDLNLNYLKTFFLFHPWKLVNYIERKCWSQYVYYLKALNKSLIFISVWFICGTCVTEKSFVF